jgi:carboxyl-terminal processing protease
MTHRWIWLLPLWALAQSGAAQSPPITPETRKEVLTKVSEIIEKYAFVPNIDFKQWPTFLESERERIDAAGTEEEFQRAVNSVLMRFGASHFLLSTPRIAETRRSGNTVGIGVMTQQDGDALVILRVIPGAPAEGAGLVAGDRILEVDGKKVEGTRGIAGPEGTPLSLKVKKAGGQVTNIKLTRKKFSTLRPEEIAFVNDDTLRIVIPTFDLSYDAKRVEGLMAKAVGKKNLIVDLRDNGGGAVFNLQHFLSFFVPRDQPIGTFVTRRASERFAKETGQSPTDVVAVAKWNPAKLLAQSRTEVPRYAGNVVVLINGGSGSASEMAAAALRDHSRAKVVGTRSAGAVLVSVIVPVGGGFTLQYPLSDYVTTNGQRLEGEGVLPDVEVEEPRLRLPTAPDPVVLKATETLKSMG